MASFDDMLASLHSEGAIVDAEQDNPIVVNAKRLFEIPKNYNLVLAYEGDVNSQIVTFKLPRRHEGHDLAACNFKGLRWKNLSTNTEDWSNLEPGEVTDTHQCLKWIVPPTAFSQSGTIEIAISLYDLVNNRIAFSWNTATFSGFTVGRTLSDIGYRGQISAYRAPAKNEILRIYEDGKSIVAPSNYNFTIANYGSENTSIVHFQTNRIVGGIDLLDSNTKISIFVSLSKATGEYFIDSNDIFPTYAEDSEGEGFVNFLWKVPTAITYNVFGYKGNFSITVCFQNGEKTWLTSSFNKLSIGNAVVYNYDEALPQEYYNILDGDASRVDLTPRTVPAVIKMRSEKLSEIEEKTIRKNEMVILYDDSNNNALLDIAIGKINGQTIDEASTIQDIVENYLKEANIVINGNL